MYLLDTNIVSELRRTRPHGAVLAWLDGIANDELCLSAVTVGEIQAGIELTREGDAAKADEIEKWLDRVLETWNILSVDAQVFRRWARLMHRKPNDLIEDALIAATALVRDFIVVTRNVRDFQAFGVRTLNPFAARRG